MVDNEVRKIEKAVRCAGREDQANSKAVLRAYVAKSLDAERALVQSKQRAAWRKRKMAGIVNAKKKKAARKKSFAAKAKAALKAKIETLPKTFTAAMCGAPAPGGLAARVLCLERLKLHAPELDFEREHTWKFLKGEIAKGRFFLKCVGLTGKGASIGHAFVNEVDEVVKSLKEFYGGLRCQRRRGPRVATLRLS